MITGPMFASIRWGTYAFFGALNLRKSPDVPAALPASHSTLHRPWPLALSYSIQASSYPSYLFSPRLMRTLRTRTPWLTFSSVIVLPGVIFYFPETKRYSLEELDLIFAIGHDESISPVKVSRRGDIPEAGSKEAEAILGGSRRVDPEAAAGEGGKRRFSLGGGGKGEKAGARHAEDVRNVA